jgi:hypothetical protein
MERIMTRKDLSLIIILIVTLILLPGCISQSNTQTNDQDSNLPTGSVRDLHTVNFHFVDQNDTPIDHALVSATDNSSTNSLKCYTDENGNLSFVMRGSIQYNITVSNLRDGQARGVFLFPTDTEYTWPITPIPTPTPKPDPNAKLVSDVQKLNKDANTVANGIIYGFNLITDHL